MIPDNPSPTELENLASKRNLHILNSDTGHSMCDGCFYISGNIPRVTTFETGLSGHFRRLRDGNWIPDAEIFDERYVACYLEGQGIIIFSACSHAGIINVCRDAMMKLRCDEIAGIVGGLHLAGSSVENRIDDTIRELKALRPKLILAGHCTGWRAKVKLAMEFNTNYQPLCTGGLYHFRSSSAPNGEDDQESHTAH
jgi:7,8-dihydropterin-6-yl-methyl-4-(beta-D-ribofuranosyl)aminobenzene 5'-phosphate synthase